MWNCPSCHGSLEKHPQSLECEDCKRQFPIICEIPDLRLEKASWIDFEHDRERAVTIDEIANKEGSDAAIYDVFRSSRKFTEEKSRYRVKQVKAGIEKCTLQVDGWLASTLDAGKTLDLGCGPGQLSVAGAKRGIPIAALDVSLEWLVIAKHLVREAGGDPELAAGLAEALPLGSDTLGGLVSLDVIEHVGDQLEFIQEIQRVVRPDGRFVLAAPNRFSLSPEPHVGVWGVGYLPVSLQAKWVKLVSGSTYEFTRLLSVRELKGLAKKGGVENIDIQFPPISDEELAIFSPMKRRLGGLYNGLLKYSVTKLLIPYFGAYYRAFGRI